MMPMRGKVRRYHVTLALLFMTVFVACIDKPSEITGPEAEIKALAVVGMVNAAELRFDPHRPPENASIAIARQVPSYGGFQFSNGTLYALLTDVADLPRVDGLLRALIADDSNLRRRTGADPNIVARAVEYSFAELKTWRDHLWPHLFNIDGVNSVGIHLSTNRIVVGASLGAKEELITLVTSMGVPIGAFRFENTDIETNSPLLSADASFRGHQRLNHYHNPLIGGVNMKAWWHDGDGCTLGFVGEHHDYTRLFTASHCADPHRTPWGGAGTIFYHNVAVDSSHYMAGMGIYGPPAWDCGFDWKCRNSDTILLQLSNTFQATRGYIGRLAPNSLNVDHDNPTYRVVGTYDWPYENQQVSMLSYQGRRDGIVQDECGDYQIKKGYFAICQVAASYLSFGGDSGAPVLILVGGSDVMLAGMHWGNHKGNPPAFFSPMGAIVLDFGPTLKVNEASTDPTAPPPPPPPGLSVQVVGPHEMLPYDQCLFTAQVNGGQSPYSYSWTADFVPIGNTMSLYHTAAASSFRIEVTVTDSQNSLATNWIDVSVHYNAPPCTDM
jgi:hypothetical protein